MHHVNEMHNLISDLSSFANNKQGILGLQLLYQPRDLMLKMNSCANYVIQPLTWSHGARGYVSHDGNDIGPAEPT